MKRLTSILTAVFAVLAGSTASAQDPVNYASLFGFSTGDGLVDCTGQFWSGGDPDAMVFCEGRNGRGSNAQATCDLSGCDSGSSTRAGLDMPWDPMNPLPEGTVIGGGERLFSCRILHRLVTCQGPRGSFTVSGDGVMRMESR